MSPVNPPDLFANLDAVAARAIALRHELHQHPQLAYQETYAASLIRKELQHLNIQFTPNLAGGTGTVALIHGTAPSASPPKCVALRADIDALPIHESTNLPYASKSPGLMHACGHDGHTAILLATAATLQAHTPHFTGTVKLLFQPAEEGGCGAEKMIEDLALQNPQVDAIFGLHGWPSLKVGTVGTRKGPLMASVDGFKITLRGLGGHAAAPHTTVDPIICGASLVQALQTIVSREQDPTDSAVLTVAQFNAGTTFNVIPDHAELTGTIRALNESWRAKIITSLERIAHGIAAAHRCSVTIEYFGTTPCTDNFPAMAEFVQQTADAVLGPNHFEWFPKPAMWGEDFAFYLQKVPGCFFALGVQPHNRDSYPTLHHPSYDFTDSAIPVGIRMMTELAIRFLKQ